MQAGAALAFISDIVGGLINNSTGSYAYSSSAPGVTTLVSEVSVVSGVIGGIITVALWLWMAWKTGEGRSWARVVSTVFFGISCLSLLDVLGLAANILFASVLFTVVTWGIGLAALIMLWKRESSAFFIAAKQAKLAGRYGLYQGYGQPQDGGQNLPL